MGAPKITGARRLIDDVIRSFLVLLALGTVGKAAMVSSEIAPPFPTPLSEYHDDAIPNTIDRLIHRVKVDPFNLVATIIFFCAITHTFLTSVFTKTARRFEHEFVALEAEELDPEHGKVVARRRDKLQFRAQLFGFLGEVEAVFGIWLVPLFLAIVTMKGWTALIDYSSKINAAEPIFVVAIMAMASSKPILRIAERGLAGVAGLGGYGPAAWWVTILCLGPLLGSFITEPGAMTICAVLLRDRIYNLSPSKELRYATLGLLFVGVSVGGTLSQFAAPPVVMVASVWQWNFSHMFTNFGWKAAFGIFLATTIYFFRFRKELFSLSPERLRRGEETRPIPKRILAMHVLFMGWVIATAHYPVTERKKPSINSPSSSRMVGTIKVLPAF
jgi:hypothetical protein